MITQERLKELLSYDPLTGIFARKACAGQGHRPVGQIAGTLKDGYVIIYLDSKPYRAHRLAWLYVFGVLPSKELDHINRQRADNRIANLRLATHAQNTANHSLNTRNRSGVSGVSWNQRDQRWVAFLGKRPKLYLGSFVDFEMAVACRRVAEQQRFGEFAPEASA